jgi:hypothetical protein
LTAALSIAGKSALLLVLALIVAGVCEATRRRYGGTIGKDVSRVLDLVRNALLVIAGLAALLLLVSVVIP